MGGTRDEVGCGGCLFVEVVEVVVEAVVLGLVLLGDIRNTASKYLDLIAIVAVWSGQKQGRERQGVLKEYKVYR